MAGGIHPPLSIIQSWPQPNHVNPETRGSAAPIFLIILFALTFVVYSARMWARLKITDNAGLDDLLISIAMVFLVGTTAAVILGIHKYGYQWHVWDQTAQTQITTRQTALAIEMLYLQSTTLTKISILCFYRRLTSGSATKVFSYCVRASIVFVLTSAVLYTFLTIFMYTPIEAFWHVHDTRWRLQHKFHSLDEAAVIVSITVIGTVQDLLICALPMNLVWNLQIETRQKVASIGIFGLGLLSCICGIMRAYYVTFIYYNTYDITWYAYYAWVWTTLEAELGVICASAPALKVIFRRYFNQSPNLSGNSGPNGSNGAWSPIGESHKSNRMGKTDIVPMDSVEINIGPRVDESGKQGSLEAFPSTEWPLRNEDNRF